MYAHEPLTVRGLQLQIAQFSKEDTHSFLDKALLDARMTVQAIGAVKNMCSSINSLPEELFTKILCYCVAPADDYEVVGRYEATSWEEHVSYTLVCKHWRETLLSFPGYWACIPPLKNKHFPEMLARSQNAPFALRAGWEPPEEPLDETEPLVHHAQHYPSTLSTERLEELRVQAVGSSFRLQQMPATPTPVLRSISLEGIRRGGFPPHLLTVPKPALQSLYLGEMEVPWEEIMKVKPTFPALRTFEINSVYTEIEVHHLLQLLSSMKELRTIYLYAAMPEESTLFDSSEQAPTGLLTHVRLDHLSKLYVRDSLSNCTMLMSHLTFPVSAEASVNIASDAEDWTAEEMEQEMKTLINSFPEPQFNELAFALPHDDLEDLEVECYLRDNASINLSLYKRVYIDALTIPGVTRISFNETSSDADLRLLAQPLRAEWIRVFARHPDVECVGLFVAPDAATVSEHMRLIPLLLEDATDLLAGADIPPSRRRPLNTTESNLLLPALNNLYMEGVPFRDGDLTKLKEAVKRNLAIKDPSFRFFLRLVDVCGFTEAMFKELKMVSPRLSVKWDHIVRDLPRPVDDTDEEEEVEGGEDNSSDENATDDDMESE